MPNQETQGAQGRPVWMFMIATAMATTVSTLAATAMVKAEAPQPAQPTVVTCACETPASPEPQALAPTPSPQDEDQLRDPRFGPPIQTQGPDALTAEVHGALPKDMVRRIVRAHINEVRHCYNEGLTVDPELAGNVTVQFVIEPSGKVGSAEVLFTDLEQSDVAGCISNAVGRWLFPRPADGDSVVVTYPFTLEPG